MSEHLTENAEKIDSITKTEIKKVEIKINESMPGKQKRNYTQDPMYAVLKKARKQFERQVIQDNITKRKCILANIKDFYSDGLRFWTDFNKEVGSLLDSKKFCEYCEKHGHNSKFVAEHILVEGKTLKQNVLRDGLGVGVTSERIKMFNGALFDDTEKIYNEAEGQKSEVAK